MRVSIRELKSQLSKYLSEAQAGQPIEVTSHRKVVARVTGVPQSPTPGLRKLVAIGAATWSGGKPACASIKLVAKGSKVSDMVLEDRGD